jgi:hypothetical protein
VSTFDITKLAKVVAMADSVHDSEALAAVRRANRMLKDADKTWADVLGNPEELKTAKEAAAVLLAENTQLRAEKERLEAMAATTAWSSVASGGDHQLSAQWALDLHRDGTIHLSAKEVDFLKNCSKWNGKLTPMMTPWHQTIVERIVSRTGLTPPP